MLMGHPPPIVARGRENRPRGGFEGPMPRQVPMVMEELVACDAQVQEALADPREVVQEITQAGPQAFHCVTVHTRAVRITTSCSGSLSICDSIARTAAFAFADGGRIQRR